MQACENCESRNVHYQTFTRLFPYKHRQIPLEATGHICHNCDYFEISYAESDRIQELLKASVDGKE